MHTIHRNNAEHYTWPSYTSPGETPQSDCGPVVCDGWHLHRSDTLSVIEERMPPDAAEQRHLHQRSTQFFYVIAGELTLELNGETLTLTSGDGCTVYPGTPHQVLNRGGQDARFLVISEPPSHGDRHHAAQVAAEAGKRISKQ